MTKEKEIINENGEIDEDNFDEWIRKHTKEEKRLNSILYIMMFLLMIVAFTMMILSFVRMGC